MKYLMMAATAICGALSVPALAEEAEAAPADATAAAETTDSAAIDPDVRDIACFFYVERETEDGGGEEYFFGKIKGRTPGISLIPLFTPANFRLSYDPDVMLDCAKEFSSTMNEFNEGAQNMLDALKAERGGE